MEGLDFNSVSLQELDQYLVSDTSIWVEKDHVFRHAKELKNATHGGYLEGHVLLPPEVQENGIVKLSPHPVIGSKQILQPNMFHVTIMSNTKKSIFKSELTERDWRVLVRIRQGEAFLMVANKSGGFDEKEIGCIQGNKLILGGNSGLLLTVITPLQNNKRGEANGVRICDVVEDRIRMEAGRYGANPVASEITAQFTERKVNPEAKMELHRCRVEANFLDESMTRNLAPAALSGDICNSKHNDVGALELHDMSDPRSSCCRGGYKVLLSSEFKAPTFRTDKAKTPIQAVFVIERNRDFHLAEKLYPNFNQISLDREKFQIHHNTITFRVPEQDPMLLRRLSKNNDILKIALYRPHDQRFSNTKFRFDYLEHVHDECHFCSIMGNTTKDGLRMYTPARRDVRRRVTDGGRRPASSSPTSGVCSPGTSSNDGSCDWSPAPQKQRRLSNDSTSNPESPLVEPNTVDNFLNSVAKEISDFQVDGQMLINEVSSSPQQFSVNILSPANGTECYNYCSPQTTDNSMNIPDLNAIGPNSTGETNNSGSDSTIDFMDIAAGPDNYESICGHLSFNPAFDFKDSQSLGGGKSFNPEFDVKDSSHEKGIDKLVMPSSAMLDEIRSLCREEDGEDLASAFDKLEIEADQEQKDGGVEKLSKDKMRHEHGSRKYLDITLGVLSFAVITQSLVSSFFG